jgi:galactose-1-phosphate uridylyltransferase
MSTNTFHNHYVTCPICQRNNRTTPIRSYIGLFTCPYCQEKLVVCQSGHYVRDPFIWRQMMISSDLRRQSRPLARMIRDFISIKRPLLSLVLGSVVFLAIMTITQNNTSQDSQEITRIEGINKVEK